MDIKTLGATLVALMVAFTGMNGTAFTADDLSDVEVPDESEGALESFVPDLSILDRLNRKPEPENEVNASIDLEGDETINLRDARVNLNTRSVESDSINLESDQNVSLYNFTGEVNLEDDILSGEAKGFNSSNVDIESPADLRLNLSSETFSVEDNYRSSLEYSNASIEPIEGTGFGIDAQNVELTMNSFSGDMLIDPDGEIELRGKVDTLSAGSYSLG